jgi:hypothetical protein
MCLSNPTSTWSLQEPHAEDLSLMLRGSQTGSTSDPGDCLDCVLTRVLQAWYLRTVLCTRNQYSCVADVKYPGAYPYDSVSCSVEASLSSSLVLAPSVSSPATLCSTAVTRYHKLNDFAYCSKVLQAHLFCLLLQCCSNVSQAHLFCVLLHCSDKVSQAHLFCILLSTAVTRYHKLTYFAYCSAPGYFRPST